MLNAADAERGTQNAEHRLLWLTADGRLLL